MNAPFKTHKGFTLGVSNNSCDGDEFKFKDFLNKKYPSLTVEIGLETYLCDDKGNFYPEYESFYWDQYCSQ